MLLRLLKITAIFLVLLAIDSCIEPYDVRYDLSADILTVDGLITDQPGATVAIKRSVSDGSIYTVPVEGCTVEIALGNGSKLNLKETSAGVYAVPADFKGVAEQTYQLQFKTPEGKNYQSSVERMQAVPDIKKVYQTFNHRGLLDRTGTRVLASTFDIFVDLDDPADQKNAYLWKWQLFENQNICATCEQGIGILNRNNFQCFSIPNSPTYDYVCATNCWQIYYNTDINVLSDVFSNGRTIAGRRVAQVPYYSDNGSLIEVQQYAISNEAYQYYLLLRDQSQTTGTLADTPPAPLIGNIKNTANNSEIVVGYFGAAGVKKVRYWVERSGNKDGIKISQLGRAVNLEPSSGPPPRPPSAPCVAGRNRTPLRPEGWR